MEREQERDRQTDRERQRETERETERQREIEGEREQERERVHWLVNVLPWPEDSVCNDRVLHKQCRSQLVADGVHPDNGITVGSSCGEWALSCPTSTGYDSCWCL